MKYVKTLAIHLLIVSLPLACSGCITAGIVIIGTVLGALGSAASTGADVYKLGKLDSALYTSGDACFQAVLLAAKDMDLHVRHDLISTKDEGYWDVSMFDDKGAEIDVHIEGRTHNFCRCRVDIGIFGSEPTARLFQDRIRKHLSSEAVVQEPTSGGK